MTDQNVEVNENSKVTIKRGKHNKENPYVMISKKMLRDPELAPRDKGVLCYLLSMPDDWITHPSQVAGVLGISRDSMYKILSELIRLGYAVKKADKDERGRFGSVQYFFFEERQIPSDDFKKISTVSEKPEMVFPDPKSRTLLNTYNTENIKKTNITPPSPSGDSPIGEEGRHYKIPDKIPKRTKTQADFSEQVRELSERMVNAIKQAVPVFRQSLNPIPFLKHVHYLVDNDQYTPELIMQVLQYALDDDIERDNFKGWQSVMLSKNPAETLRKHFVKIYSQMKSKPKEKERKFAPSSDQNKALKAMEEMRKTAL